jgi:hypothetical protein
MGALRTAALTTIKTGEKQSSDTYSIETAMTDLGTYFDAGTVLTALQDINKETGTIQNKNTTDLKTALQ